MYLSSFYPISIVYWFPSILVLLRRFYLSNELEILGKVESLNCWCTDPFWRNVWWRFIENHSPLTEVLIGIAMISVIWLKFDGAATVFLSPQILRGHQTFLGAPRLFTLQKSSRLQLFRSKIPFQIDILRWIENSKTVFRKIWFHVAGGEMKDCSTSSTAKSNADGDNVLSVNLASSVCLASSDSRERQFPYGRHSASCLLTHQKSCQLRHSNRDSLIHRENPFQNYWPASMFSSFSWKDKHWIEISHFSLRNVHSIWFSIRIHVAKFIWNSSVICLSANPILLQIKAIPPHISAIIICIHRLTASDLNPFRASEDWIQTAISPHQFV